MDKAKLIKKVLNPYFEAELKSIIYRFRFQMQALDVDLDTKSGLIEPKNGLGGIGGDYCKPIALANVRQFYNLLNIPIIGCGGIKNGTDIFEHILAGASAVQIGTQLVKEGPKCFARLEKELINIMSTKGYHNINEFKGKLRVVNNSLIQRRLKNYVPISLCTPKLSYFKQSTPFDLQFSSTL